MRKVRWTIGYFVIATHGDGQCYSLYYSQSAGVQGLWMLHFSERSRCPCFLVIERQCMCWQINSHQQVMLFFVFTSCVLQLQIGKLRLARKQEASLPCSELDPTPNCFTNGVSQPSQCFVVCEPPTYSTSQSPSKEKSNMCNLTRFMARNKFKPVKPGDYWAWKSPFENAIQGLHLVARKEVDLFPKWLGEECGGSPEALEKALFEMIEFFPRISNKNPHLLCELGDFLLEIDCQHQSLHTRNTVPQHGMWNPSYHEQMAI